MTEHASSGAWLFVPGHTSVRFDKAARTGADHIVLDLEDAVNPAKKAEARENVVRWLSSDNAAWVRVNAASSEWFEDDLASLVDLPGLRGVMLPKANDDRHLARITVMLRTPVIPLVETANGLLKAHELANSRGVLALAFGSLDYSVDIGAEHSEPALLFARNTLVMASRAASINAPIDGVTADFTDLELVESEAIRAKKLGFRGKLCIHPQQVKPTQSGLRPDASEITWARSILEGTDGDDPHTGPDGAMVDKPILDRARRIMNYLDNPRNGQ